MTSNAPREHSYTSVRGGLLTKDSAMSIATKLLGWIRTRSVGVQSEHRRMVITKIVNGQAQITDDGDELAIRFSSQFGSSLPVTIGLNQVHDTTLRAVVEQLEAMAPAKPGFVLPDDLNDPIYYTYNKREYLPVSLWHDSTIAAMESMRYDTVPVVVDQVGAARLSAAATIGVSARASLTLYQAGLTSWSEETDAEVTLTVRTPDEKTSGWAGQAHRDWRKIDSSTVVRHAIELTERGKNAVGMEPGRYTTILGPAAVVQLIRFMPEMFDGHDTDVYKSTPFAELYNESKMNKIGDLMLDRRLQMVSDPQDPDGGYPPFFEVGSGKGVAGFPVGKQMLIDHGILTNLSYDLWNSLGIGKPPADNPHSLRLGPVSGVPTSTIDEMIAQCEHGVYVNRFSNVSLLSKKTGMMTGVTRDGCFHIKNGRINKPIKNLRFTDSPMFAFNRLLMIGVSERAAFGYTPPTPSEWGNLMTWPAIGRATRWPRLPMIVPPMMIRDFNFSALAEAV